MAGDSSQKHFVRTAVNDPQGHQGPVLATEVISDLHPEDSTLITSQAPNVSSSRNFVVRTGPSSPPPPMSSGAARRVGYTFSNACTQRDGKGELRSRPRGPSL